MYVKPSSSPSPSSHLHSLTICTASIAAHCRTLLTRCSSRHVTNAATVSSYLGAYLANEFGIETRANVAPWNFDNLSKLLVLGHFIMPLCCIPLTFILIPDAKMSDEFDTSELDCVETGNEDAEDGIGHARRDQVVPSSSGTYGSLELGDVIDYDRQ
jgi:hypothetical protein